MPESIEYQLGSIQAQVNELYKLAEKNQKENEKSHSENTLRLIHIEKQLSDFDKWRWKIMGAAAAVALLISVSIPQVATIASALMR